MDTAQFLADLRAERDRIDNAIAALEALVTTDVYPAIVAAKSESEPKPAKTRVLSAAGKKHIVEANRKRWAAVNAQKSPAKSAKAPAAKKSGKPMSEATKKRLSELAKKRWAAKKGTSK